MEFEIKTITQKDYYTNELIIDNILQSTNFFSLTIHIFVH